MTDICGRYLLLYFTTITLVSILLPSFFWIFPCGPQFVGTTFFGLTCSGSVDVFLVAKLLISYLIELALVVGCCGPTLIFGTVAILSHMCLNTYLKFFRLNNRFCTLIYSNSIFSIINLSLQGHV